MFNFVAFFSSPDAYIIAGVTYFLSYIYTLSMLRFGQMTN